MKHLKRLKQSIALILMIALVAPAAAFAQEADYGEAKNVIVMIPDGMNIESLTTARWFREGNQMTLDEMATGLVRTNNASTPIADSAPAGTAMATGIKTNSPYVGSYPSEVGMPGAAEFEAWRAKMPIANVLEGAKTLGKSTGIVSTSNVQHATPADFSAHHPDRNNYEALGEQQVYQNIDVVLGAGSKYLNKDHRADGEDLIGELKASGYSYITKRDELLNSNATKLWGLFAEKSLAYNLDRDPAVEPTLAEMTQKALDILSQNDKGFFLMVEGSEVDWGAHANDPVAVVSDIHAFDDAVKVAKDFADQQGDTVIVIAADHGTGGMTFGERAISKGYDKAPLDEFTHIIKNAKKTGLGAAEEIAEDKSNIKDVMAANFGITDLTPEEEKSIAEANDMQMAIGHVISNRSHIGWTTGGHVGGDVALYCYVKDARAKELKGTVHNKDIGLYVADLFNLDLNALTDQLFIKARDGFEKNGAKVDFTNDNNNPEITVTKGEQKIVIPMYKNYALVGDKKVDLGSVTVFNGSTCYVPQTALDLIK